jgi:hypothetical protein
MSKDDSKDEPASRAELRKEQARQIRKQAYQSAKERRAKDPKYIAMKEAVKERRRAEYQKIKERRKAVASEQKTKLKDEKAAQRASKDLELMQMVQRATNASKDPYDIN